MREFLIVLFVIGALGVCFASWMEGRHESSKFGAETWGKEPELWIDPETNCQYFRVMGGITPRLGTDGFPLCNFELQVGRE